MERLWNCWIDFVLGKSSGVEWWLGIVLWLLFLTPIVLEARDDFEHPNSFIGNAGWSGGLERWVEIADVPIGKGICLPLRLRFASDATRVSPLFKTLGVSPCMRAK